MFSISKRPPWSWINAWRRLDRLAFEQVYVGHGHSPHTVGLRKTTNCLPARGPAFINSQADLVRCSTIPTNRPDHQPDRCESDRAADQGLTIRRGKKHADRVECQVLGRPQSRSRNRIDRDRFELSIRSRSATNMFFTPRSARSFKIAVAGRPAPDHHYAGTGLPLLVPPTDEPESREPVFRQRVHAIDPDHVAH